MNDLQSLMGIAKGSEDPFDVGEAENHPKPLESVKIVQRFKK
jgi:hypothetical protein